MRDLSPPPVARGLILAQRLFQDALLRPEAAVARSYLSHRPGADIPASGLGVGLRGYSLVLTAWGVSDQVQTEIGLLDHRGRETMAGRVTFPWLSIGGGRVLGIGGRAWAPDGRPKYANSPESTWFGKGRTLYGLPQASAAIHGAGWALVCEGPFDALALWSLGWTNAVATVGAKVTLDQLLLLGRLCDRVVVMLDNDEGGNRGQESMSRVLQDSLIPPTMSVARTTLRGAKDAGTLGVTQVMVAEAVQAALPL